MNDEPIRILVVDDEVGMREGCRRILTAEGYDVQTAEDGQAGLDIFRAGVNFAAALIDLKMPRMGGLELIEKMRQHRDDAVLFVITAYATIDTAVEATKRGAYAYIPKPFTPDELLLPVKHGLETRALSLEAKRLRQEKENRLLEVAFERSKSNTIINCMTDGVLVINRDRQIVLRNAAAARALQECSAAPLPAPLDVLACPSLRALIAEILGARSGPRIVSKEIALGQCTYMVNASPVIEPSGETLGAVAVLRDITALKKLEIAKSMFVSMVAHEVKNPLAAIEGYLNVILSGAVGDDRRKEREMLERALLRAGSLRALVSELITLRAIETGHFSLTRSPLDIKEVVAEVVQMCQGQAAQKEIELTTHYEERASSRTVLADREAMASVFTNLIDNAVKYTPAKGHVEVGLENNGVYLRAVVRDDGIGMSAEEKERAFEEFFRAKNEYTAHIPGTGLGLSLVKRLVEMHQGKITLKSSPGKGSEFAVYLPIAEPRQDGAR